MTHDEFGIQIDRLKAAYREGAYPDERVAQIFMWAKGMNVEVLEKVISKLIAESLTPPLLPQFREAYGSIAAQMKANHQKCVCQWCSPPGVIVGLWRDDPLDIEKSEDFACPHCKDGRDKTRLRFWEDSHSEKYLTRQERQEQVAKVIGGSLHRLDKGI